jgi:5'(3')-deoxyribonucleotidase
MIFWDMDGVLCDFDGTYTTIAGMKWDHATAKTREQKREKWSRLDAHPRFFAELPWMPGAKDMLLRIREKVGADHIGILSAAAKHLPDCPAQKLEWLERETPWIEPQNRLIVLRKRDKTLHACGNMLVDDMDLNIENWAKAGGCGVLYVDALQAEAEINKWLGF